MILFDLNQVLIAGIMGQMKSQNVTEVQEDLLRHMVLNTIRYHVNNFKSQYGEVVLCSDSKNSWRKSWFPQYKANRKKSRDNSSLDWNKLFSVMNMLKQEMKENLPYRFIEIETAEADDIIATLVEKYISHEDILILSSDGDFIQLQKFNNQNSFNIKQFNPTLKRYIESDNPVNDLKEKIIRGDKGDGIPNILSNSDVFINETRQNQISKKTFEKYMNGVIEKYDDLAKTGFMRNQVLIDFTFIPVELKDKIINTYESVNVSNKKQLLEYFVKNDLKTLVEVIEEF